MGTIYKVELLGSSLAIGIVVAIHFAGARIGFRKSRAMFALACLVLFVTKTLTSYLIYRRSGFKPYLLIPPLVNLGVFFWAIFGRTSTQRFLALIVRKNHKRLD